MEKYRAMYLHFVYSTGDWDDWCVAVVLTRKKPFSQRFSQDTRRERLHCTYTEFRRSVMVHKFGVKSSVTSDTVAVVVTVASASAWALALRPQTPTAWRAEPVTLSNYLQMDYSSWHNAETLPTGQSEGFHTSCSFSQFSAQASTE